MVKQHRLEGGPVQRGPHAPNRAIEPWSDRDCILWLTVGHCKVGQGFGLSSGSTGGMQTDCISREPNGLVALLQLDTTQAELCHPIREEPFQCPVSMHIAPIDTMLEGCTWTAPVLVCLERPFHRCSHPWRPMVAPDCCAVLDCSVVLTGNCSCWYLESRCCSRHPPLGGKCSSLCTTPALGSL